MLVVAERMCVNSMGLIRPEIIIILHLIMIHRKMEVLRSSCSTGVGLESLLYF